MIKMADFCNKCEKEMFGQNLDHEYCEEGYIYNLLCEGCGGWVWVDWKGNRINNSPPAR